MNKADLIHTLMDSCEDKLNRVEADTCIDSLINLMTTRLLKGEYVRIDRFGSFEAVKRAPRMGANINTGEPLAIPAKTRVKFRTSGILKRKLTKKDINEAVQSA